MHCLRWIRFCESLQILLVDCCGSAVSGCIFNVRPPRNRSDDSVLPYNSFHCSFVISSVLPTPFSIRSCVIGPAVFRMRSLLVFLLLTITYALAYDPVFVDELEGLVINKNDEHELGMLDDDNNMIR